VCEDKRFTAKGGVLRRPPTDALGTRYKGKGGLRGGEKKTREDFLA